MQYFQLLSVVIPVIICMSTFVDEHYILTPDIHDFCSLFFFPVAFCGYNSTFFLVGHNLLNNDPLDLSKGVVVS